MVQWRPEDTRNKLAVIVVQVRKVQLAISVLELPNALRTSKATSEHAAFQNLH